MKVGGAPLSELVRARARALGVRAPDAHGSHGSQRPHVDGTARAIAAELNVDVGAVKAELLALANELEQAARGGPAPLERFQGGARDVVPAALKAAPATARSLDLLAATRAMGSTKKWDPVARLPASLRARLSPGDLKLIEEAIDELQRSVRAAKLDGVPVFGYLSLRTHNFAELGKQSQDEVVAGRDVFAARLPGFDVDVVASSMYRGTPAHPGAVAGLGKKEGAVTPGVVLKVPLARAEELLAVLLARELFAEGDLKDGVGRDGAPVSNAMYAPAVLTVTIDDETAERGWAGRSVPALVFVTNETGAKAVSRPGAFGDDQGLTTERLAYLFASQGGFVNAAGQSFGGPSVDYWQKSYLEARRAAGQPVDPQIAAAIELSKLHPQQAVVDRLLARTDRDAKLMVEALRHLFQGAATPLGLQRAQKADAGARDPAGERLVRTPQGARGDDATARLLQEARALERAGKIRVE